MQRRDFITLLGGAAATWPLAVHAQQVDRTRRIAVLSALTVSDPQAEIIRTTLRQALQKLGWADGGNVRIDYRWRSGSADA
jgi:putative ABC transport system substrate-binding protein